MKSINSGILMMILIMVLFIEFHVLKIQRDLEHVVVELDTGVCD